MYIPPAAGPRGLRIQCSPPKNGRVSALLIWTPPEYALTARIQRLGMADPFARASGRSPIALGAAVDTGEGPCFLMIDEPAGGADSVQISLQLNWSGPTGERPWPTVSVETSATRATFEVKPPVSAPASLTCRITDISWTEGADLDRMKLMREGLKIRFGSAVNKEMLEGAIRCSIGMPGSQDGLIRFEDVRVELRMEDQEVRLIFPPKLLFARRSIVRVTVIGDRVLSRDGTFVDAEGSGFKLPSGNGMPGGIFQSEFIVP